MQKFTNHIAMVIDKSGSMSSLSHKVVEVFDKEIDHLRQRSIDLDQETRVSIYLFDDHVKCIAFDMDAMRVKTLRGLYNIGGQTALIDATAQAIQELGKIPELHSDHAFLIVTISDGQENASKNKPDKLTDMIHGLPDNWTVVAQVPNASAVHEAKKFGFPAGNVQIWDVSSTGLESAAKATRSAIDTYMTNRASGTRGTKSFFTTDLGNVTTKAITSALNQLKVDEYSIYDVRKDVDIKSFVESWEKNYIKGSAYFELNKAESIQNYKQVAIQNRKNGKVYGGDNARKLLGLPDYEIKVSPGDHGDWRIFVQSTSLNRRLMAGTQLLVMK